MSMQATVASVGSPPLTIFQWLKMLPPPLESQTRSCLLLPPRIVSKVFSVPSVPMWMAMFR